MKTKNPLVAKKEVVETKSADNAQIRQAVASQEAVANFLRALADQAAVAPDVHPEIVKSATLLRLFLENQAAGARKQFATAFEGPVDAVS